MEKAVVCVYVFTMFFLKIYLQRKNNQKKERKS